MTEFGILFVICFIATLGYVYLFCRINMISKITKLSFFVILLGSLLITFFKYFNIKYYALFCFFLFYPLLFLSISKFSIKKIIVNTLLIWLIAMILDLIFMLIATSVSELFNINLYKFYVIITSASSIFLVLFLFCIGHFEKTRKILLKIVSFFYDIEYLDYSLIIFSFFVCVLAICIFLNLQEIKIDVLLFIIIILSIFFFILLVKTKVNDIENKKYLENLRDNNDFYIKMDDENRIFKHNLMTKLSSIKSVSNKKAIALIDDIVVKTNKTNSFSKKIKTIPYGLNGIIYQKAYPFLEDINFKLINKIDFDIFKVLKPRRYNVLIEKVLVSLDNAIEASLNSKNKVVVINLYDDEDNIYIEIKNSFAYNLDIDKLGNLNYSTKGKRRGLGLFSILRDNEASLKVKVVNNYFISIITARKQK